MKRLFCIVFLLPLLATIALASGADEGGAAADTAGAVKVNPAGVLPITDEPLTIEIFSNENPKADLENNSFLDYLEEKTNIRLDVVQRPTNESEAKTLRNLI